MHTIRLATAEGTIKGTLSIDSEKKEIVSLFVGLLFRHQGVATYLIKEAELWAKAHNIKSLFATTLLSNKNTQRLFHKLGYTKLLKYEKQLGEK